MITQLEIRLEIRLEIPRFEQYALNMALVHLCDREGYVGQLSRRSNDTEVSLQQVTISVSLDC